MFARQELTARQDYTSLADKCVHIICGGVSTFCTPSHYCWERGTATLVMRCKVDNANGLLHVGFPGVQAALARAYLLFVIPLQTLQAFSCSSAWASLTSRSHLRLWRHHQTQCLWVVAEGGRAGAIWTGGSVQL